MTTDLEKGEGFIVQPLKRKAKQIFTGLYYSYDWVLECFTLFQDRCWKRWLLNKAALSRNDLVLDIGCGTGVLEEQLNGVTVAGVDLTKEMLAIAKAKRIDSLEVLVLGDAEHLPFDKDTFDRVLSCYVVKYCGSRSFVRQVYRVLKPGGRLILYDFARPTGLFSPFHFFYVYGVLRAFGLLTRKFDQGISYTLSELPGIISKTRWEEELPLALAEQGFTSIFTCRMSSGAARIFWADKPMS